MVGDAFTEKYGKYIVKWILVIFGIVIILLTWKDVLEFLYTFPLTLMYFSGITAPVILGIGAIALFVRLKRNSKL